MVDGIPDAPSQRVKDWAWAMVKAYVWAFGMAAAALYVIPTTDTAALTIATIALFVAVLESELPAYFNKQ